MLYHFCWLFEFCSTRHRCIFEKQSRIMLTPLVLSLTLWRRGKGCKIMVMLASSLQTNIRRHVCFTFRRWGRAIFGTQLQLWFDSAFTRFCADHSRTFGLVLLFACSHNHYDHLDTNTVRAILDRVEAWCVPLQMKYVITLLSAVCPYLVCVLWCIFFECQLHYITVTKRFRHAAPHMFFVNWSYEYY